MIIKCIGEGCSWRLYASNVGSAKEGYFEIKTIMGEHKCFGVQHLGHRQASARFIADQIQKSFMISLNIAPKILRMISDVSMASIYGTCKQIARKERHSKQLTVR